MTDSGAPCECIFYSEHILGPVYHHSLCSYVHCHVAISMAFVLLLVIGCFMRDRIVIYPGLCGVVFGPTGLLFWLVYMCCRGRDFSKIYAESVDEKPFAALDGRTLDSRAHYSSLRYDIFK